MDLIICSGPVIIEDNKVLLIKEKKGENITPWLFPGGKVEDTDKDLESACARETKEEVGCDIEIIKQLETLNDTVNNTEVILHHFLCKRIGKIIPGETIVEWNWFDINNIPDDCADNVVQIIESSLSN